MARDRKLVAVRIDEARRWNAEQDRLRKGTPQVQPEDVELVVESGLSEDDVPVADDADVVPLPDLPPEGFGTQRFFKRPGQG